MSTPCPDCPKTFADKIAVQDHHRRCHRKPTLECFHCGYRTKFKFNLERHIKTHHINNRQPRSYRRRAKLLNALLNCCLCSEFLCEERHEMIQHYIVQHDVQIDQRTLEFTDVTEFLEWKKQTEQSECFRFVLKGKQQSSYRVTDWYRCFRDGFFHSKGTNKRRLKMRGSCRINSVCPCALKVVTSKNTGAVSVSYVPRHVGHVVDLGRMNLTQEERASIAAKLSQRIPFDAILDSIRESMTGGEYSRIHLTTRKDLANIKEAFQVNDGRLHADDRTSLEAWISSIEDYSKFVRFYKPQSALLPEHSELREEDFVLILSYDSQIEMLQKYGPSCVCFDGTHGTNSYSFELTTLLVKDGKSEGFPCAFLISNRSDSKMMELFLTVIKNLLPNPITPQVLMSDMSEVYFNGWCATMPEPKHWLFCQWHVDRAWRKNLNKIGDSKKRCSVYKLLRVLMDESDELTFRTLFEKAAAFLSSDPDLSDFFQYFSSQYSKNVRSWAFCFRPYLGINTNMKLESMHKLIKYMYLEGKKVKRLDKGINALVTFVRDKMYDQLVAKTRGKLTSRICAIRERHDKSLNMTSTVIPADNGWLVSSESQPEIYEVTRAEISCSCEDRCDECGICSHEYKCTCVDSKKSNICKHTHLVVAFIKQQNPAGRHSADVEVEPGDELIMITDQEDDIAKAFVEDLSARNKTAIDHIVQGKEALSQAFSEILKTVENVEHLNIIRKAIAPIPHTMKAVNSGLVFLPGQKKVNPLAKLSPQKPLYSTKKSNQKNKSYNMGKPTLEERRHITNQLLFNQNVICTNPEEKD